MAQKRRGDIIDVMEKEILNEALKNYLSENPWLIVILVWSLIWKALALWQSARRGEKVWYIALLVVNTMGILEIIYLLINYCKTHYAKKGDRA